MTSKQWEYMRAFAEDCWPDPIWCAELGRVRDMVVEGERVGGIPRWLASEAREHGLNVIAADFRRGAYCLKLREPPALSAY